MIFRKTFATISNIQPQRRRWRRTGFFVIVFIILVLSIYITVSSEHGGKKDILRRLQDVGDYVYENESPECELKWLNDKLRVPFYEAPSYEISDIHDDEFLRSPKPVKPIYRKTVIKLNTERFLLPVVTKGPNNQMTGFRSAAFVAIKLNRTLVLPKFFKHFSDSQGKTNIYPGHRFDVKELCTFIPCITLEQFQRTCGRKADAVIKLHTYDATHIIKLERATGVRIAEEQPDDDKSLEGIRFIPETISPDLRYRTFRPEEIHELFDTDARCVIYPFPIYNLRVPTIIKKLTAEPKLVERQEDIEKYSDSTLLLTIGHRSRCPEYIAKIANGFISTVFKGRPFLSVHWRYNKDDFMKRCTRNPRTNTLKVKLCNNVMKIKPTDIALAIEQKILFLQNTSEPVNIRDIYIASPYSERSMVNNIAEFLKSKHGWTILSSIELEDYLHNKHQACNAMRRHFNDIVSTTEMEICGLGYTFLWSSRSSWSINVKIRRQTRTQDEVQLKYDSDVFSMSVAAQETNEMDAPE